LLYDLSSSPGAGLPRHARKQRRTFRYPILPINEELVYVCIDLWSGLDSRNEFFSEPIAVEDSLVIERTRPSLRVTSDNLLPPRLLAHLLDLLGGRLAGSNNVKDKP
jgi:hypothetical protein